MTFYELLDAMTWLSPAALLAGGIIGCARFPALDHVHRVLTGYLLFELCIDTLSRVIIHYSASNLILIPFMNGVELLVFLWIYYRWFGPKSRLPVGLVMLVFGVFFVREVYEIRMLPVGQVQTYTGILEAFSIVAFALLQFTVSLRRPEQVDWQRFGFNAVILFYFSVKLVFSIPLNFLVNEDSGLSLLFWFAYLFITLFFYSYLIHLLWKNGRIRT